MAVTAKDLGPKEQQSKATAERWITLTGWAGLSIGVLAFGGVIWAINGGYSVQGLQVVAAAFNDAGQLFWALVTQLSFTIPGDLPGIEERQPLIPWCGVIAASLLQVSVLLLRLLTLRVPPALAVATALFSLYDFGTTYFGLGTAPWLRGSPAFLQGLLACLLTFSVEAAMAFLLERLVRVVRRWRSRSGG